MGASTLIFFAMPWIDNSPVRSIRYRPSWHKWVYARVRRRVRRSRLLRGAGAVPVGERLSQLVHAALLRVLPVHAVVERAGHLSAGSRAPHLRQALRPDRSHRQMNGTVPRRSDRRHPMTVLVTAIVAVIAIAMALLQAAPARAASGAPALDQFPTSKLTHQVALQDGARTFVNYCLNCHGASLMRYNRMRDIGLSEDADPRQPDVRRPEGRRPDEGGAAPRRTRRNGSVHCRRTCRSLPGRDRRRAGSGSDWLYTYLRSYYRDSTRETGWNNAVFPNVGMPHVFWHSRDRAAPPSRKSRPTRTSAARSPATAGRWSRSTPTASAARRPRSSSRGMPTSSARRRSRRLRAAP